MGIVQRNVIDASVTFRIYLAADTGGLILKQANGNMAKHRLRVAVLFIP